MSRIRGGYGQNTAWKVGAFGHRPKTHWGKGMYWGDQSIFVGKETPERMFVDWTILSRTGWEDTYGVIKMAGGWS
jgi:hypothetical protein